MICFAWAGFPQYAARCVAEVVRHTDERVVVVAAKPKVPIAGMDNLACCDVVWITYEERRPLKTLLGGCLPRVLFSTGWRDRVFRAFRDEVHKDGGLVIVMVDNNWMLGGVEWLRWRWWKLLIREFVKALRFRLILRRKYDGFIVPGKSGRRLLQFYGVPDEQVSVGMYSADAKLFNDAGEVINRPQKILYVGQYIERKNVMRMASAFAEAIYQVQGAWTLEMYGSGGLKDDLCALAERINQGLVAFGSKIVIHEFLQPEEIAPVYRSARIFCLPSLEEHWGLVVHEAALSGCYLLLSQYVGAAHDFLVQKKNAPSYVNGSMFDPYDEKALREAFVRGMTMDKQSALLAQEESVRVAQSVSLNLFAETIINSVRKEGTRRHETLGN